MRRFISLLLLPCVALMMLTSCSLFEDVADETLQIENEPIETIMDMDNLISELYSIDYQNPEDEYANASIHVPQINCDTADANVINDEIQRFYRPLVEDSIESFEMDGYYMWDDIGWEVYVDDDSTFSLLIHRSTQGFNGGYDVYNFSAVTGKVVSNSEILAKMDLTEDEFIELATSVVTDEFNRRISYADLSQEWAGTTFGDMLAESTSSDVINADMPMFIDEDGGLSIVTRINSLGGTDYEYIILKVK